MKKQYKKPEVTIERFVISEFIAGNCTQDVGFGDTGAAKLCAIDSPDFIGTTIFNDSSVCDQPYNDGTENKPCYHIPESGLGYFAS